MFDGNLIISAQPHIHTHISIPGEEKCSPLIFALEIISCFSFFDILMSSYKNLNGMAYLGEKKSSEKNRKKLL